MSAPVRPIATRRQVLQALSALGLSALSTHLAGCGENPLGDDEDDGTWLDGLDLDLDIVTAEQNVEALMDVLVPAERGPTGDVVRPGAVECGALQVLQLDTFVPVARAQGLLPAGLPDWIEEAAESLDPALLALMSAELDAMADELVPLTPFRSLPVGSQVEAVARAMVDPTRRPLMLVARGVAFIAYLGAITTDLGLVDIGFPPFESFADRRAVSGYPRTPDGRLIDPDLEDLDALAADGQLDDYTFNAWPVPTPDDDLSDVLDPNGDLL